jgi:hypothetical protein
MKAKKIHLIQVAILIATCFFINTHVIADKTSLFLDPKKLSVSKNEEFTLSVKVDSVSNLFAYQFDLKYRPRKYEIVNVEEGSFLNNNGTDRTFFLGPLNGSRKHRITFACSRMGSSGGIDGAGTLLNIRFRAKISGKVKIDIVRKSVRLLDSNGQKIQ